MKLHLLPAQGCKHLSDAVTTFQCSFAVVMISSSVIDTCTGTSSTCEDECWTCNLPFKTAKNIATALRVMHLNDMIYCVDADNTSEAAQPENDQAQNATQKADAVTLHA